MVELSPKDKKQIESTISFIYLSSTIFCAFLVLTLTRTTKVLEVSWENWMWDNIIAFIVFWFLVASILNLLRLISIKDTIKRLERDEPVFKWPSLKKEKDKSPGEKLDNKSGKTVNEKGPITQTGTNDKKA